MNDCVRSLKKLELKYWTIPCQERCKFGAGSPVLCETAYFFPVATHGAYAFMRVSIVPGKLILLIGKDTLKVLVARDLIFRVMLEFFWTLEISEAKYCARVA